MKTVTKSFKAVRPGDIYPTTVEIGEEIDGRLLEIAEELGCVEKNAKPAATAKAAKA